MKSLVLSLFCGLCLLLSARADLTILQKIEGTGQPGEMTIKIKGDKARIEASPEVTILYDAKSGDIINLINDEKKAMRISSRTAKAAAEMIAKFSDDKKGPAKSRLAPTGKKETINGQETDVYSYETSGYKATYWLAPGFPDGPNILRQLQVMHAEALQSANISVPDYRDFPGVPIKTVVSMNGSQITSTLISVKQDPLSDAEFSVPKDFEEINTPDLSDLFQGKPAPSAAASPKS